MTFLCFFAEWKAFLDRFADDKGIATCTIALDNAKLLVALIQRRKLLKQLKKMLPHGTDVTDSKGLAQVVAENTVHRWCRVPFWPTPASKHNQLLDCEQRIRQLMNCEYKAVAVYVIFESERGQRNALHALSTGKWFVWNNRVDTSKFEGNVIKVKEVTEAGKFDLNDVSTALHDQAAVQDRTIRLVDSTESTSVDKAIMFRGKHVLNVKEAPEPNDVRWKDIQVNGKVRTIHNANRLALGPHCYFRVSPTTVLFSRSLLLKTGAVCAIRWYNVGIALLHCLEWYLYLPFGRKLSW